MSSIPKANKYIIWLESLDSYVEEGSGKPSLFNTEREATRCAKDLWPKSKWRIEKFTYIKKAKQRQDKEERKQRLEITSKVSSNGFAYRFKPPVPSKPICVFLFENSREKKKPNHYTKTIASAQKWAKTAAKKFINTDHPDRAISILNCSDPDFPVWEDSIYLPVDLQDQARAKARPIVITGTEESEGGITQPIPYQDGEGLWVCPITKKSYTALSRRIFNNILKAAANKPEQYPPIKDWKAFTYGDGWICPYTGKVFKRIGKHLDTHLIKQRKLLTKGS